jgi:hypothetical protein
MKARFGDSAARLCGAARALLGWPPKEFWEATPAELACALQPMTEATELPDTEMLAELRRRFPDDMKA